MKKIFTVILATIMSTISAVSLVGCNLFGSDEQKIMNLSLNPEVEFILDADDKVVSVNALNEEGNLIVSAEVFTGKTAEEAASLFVEVSKETGFLVTGNVNAGENELKISFSGDEKSAEKLYEDVKATVDGYFTSENITATVAQATAITEQQLQALVADCAPYLDSAKIQAMEYNELIKELTESRKETAEFYSQELKNAYYEAKAFSMEQVEIQAVKVKAGITGLAGIAFDTAYGVYASTIQLIEETRMTMLVDENSPYQIALKAFRKAKTDYLNYRNYVASLEQNQITTAISEQLASYQTAVDSTETALINAGVEANNALDLAKAELKTIYDGVIELIEEYSAKVSQYADEIATKQIENQTTFFNNFETSYATAISTAKNNWSAMKTQLEQGYIAE
ncbi:MAG: hypothetical protein IKA12_05030 [Clostridia bacterium]|nr:hypothetical protein [Clostridia bacterium]